MMIQNKNVRIAAGIVLFNPDVERLKENINAIMPQVESLVLVENGSSSTAYLNEMNLEGIDVIHNGGNKGIAFALNQICQYCIERGFHWVVTLDQDSVPDRNMVDNMIPCVDSGIGIICPHIKDRNYSLESDKDNYTVREIRECFTSGSLTNLDAWKAVGGFDNSMFIDMVDFDFNYLLLEHGYKILQVRNAKLLHELGTSPRVIKYKDKEVLLLNRSPFRYYYVARNLVYMKRKHHIGNYKGILRENWDYFKPIFLYESNKWNNFFVFVKGTVDGFRMPLPAMS